MKKVVGIFFMTLLLITSFVNAVDEMDNSKSFNGSDDFTQWFENPTGESDMEGTDFTTADGAEGHIHRVTDTKSPPTEEMDICDNVVIEWKKPTMRKPWVTYHIDDMSPTGGHGWYFHFDYQSSNRKAPFNMPEPPEGLPPFPGKDKKRNHYVDDSNTAGPWDGTYDHPYNKIQDGIDAADVSDTVRVFPGTYNENLVINTDNIALVADTFELVRVVGDGSGSVTTVISEFVYISGNFEFSKSGSLEEDAGIDIRSNNNTLVGNVVENCQNGIYIHDSSSNNIIFENNIQNNVWGLFIMGDCNNNTLYNNNFISSSGFHVKDYSDNQWYSEFYHGNYWDDYIGSDNNGDGIGDIPYLIQGGDNQDNYPLVNSWENHAPGTPVINGPESGNAGETYNYTFMSSDPNEHDVIFKIKWGDGTEEKSPFYVGSDSQATYSHIWDNEDTFILEARAIDDYGSESDWSTFQVSMPKTKEFNNLFLWFLENHPYLFPILQRLLGLI